MAGFSLSPGDTLALVAALVGLGGLVGFGEWLWTKGVSAEATRRIIHVGVCLFVGAAPLIFSRPLPLYALAGLFVALNALAQSRRWWRGMHGSRPGSWGTVALPLAVLPALAATWTVASDRIFILQGAFLVLAVADPLAAVVGRAFGRREILPNATRAGSVAFLGATVLVLGTVLLGRTEWSLGKVAAATAGGAVVATATEALARRGWDNLFVVLGIVLVLMPLHEGSLSIVWAGCGFAAGVLVWGIAGWSRALGPRGAVGAGLFAATLVALGGWAWALPGFTFFVLSSALSWLPRTSRGSRGFATGREPRRTLRQVMANGGLAWGLLGLWAVMPPGSESFQGVCYTGFLGALAAAAADTWATEIGVRWGERPLSVRTLRRAAPGTSGAVSGVGTGAAILGAASVAVAALLGGGGSGSGSSAIIHIILAGLVGMITDSIAGATMEAHYRDPRTGQFVGRPVSHEVPDRGWAGIDNDVVNLICTAAGAVAAILFSGVLG